ncbi:MAG: hypothetical protein KJS87_00985 [Alphaproteobacteria bacterium]|nr:hypothetical protein [Alphaproteobacteria bacterium]
MGRFITLLNIIPLLVLPLILYNFVVMTGLAGAEPDVWMIQPIFSVNMFSGDAWGVSFADVFMGLSLLLLFVEIVKATRTDAMSIVNHGLSMLLCLVCIVQFIALKGFSNSVFFLLTMMSVLDVVAGFTITIVAAKRDFGASGGIAGTH